MNRLKIAISLIFIIISAQAFALDPYTLSNLGSLTSQEKVDTLLKPIALGMDHRAYQSASPLGLTGFDFGVSATFISLSTDFKNTMSAISSATGTASLPNTIILPKLSVHKGLPANFGLGISYSSSSLLGQGDVFSTFGWEVQWTPISGAALPSVAARFSGTYSKLWFINSTVHALDGVLSKNLILIDPYAGAGLKLWSSTLQADATILGTLPATITAESSGVSPHLFAGLSFKMLILKITGEFDYNLSGVTTYGAKVSFSF